MPDSVNGLSGGYATLADVLILDGNQTANSMATLEEQSATGYVAQTYGGIGAASQTVFELEPQINQLSSWQTNITSATSTMSLTQSTLTQISSIAQSIYDDLPELNDSGTSDVTTLASSAQQALSQIASLLDTTDGDNYIFSGQDATNPPVPSPDSVTSSGFYSQISAAVQDLSTLGASGVMSAAISAASSNTAGTTIFSTYLSSGSAAATSVETGTDQWTQTGVLANTNTLATSSGSFTTGSYMRDIMMSLSVISSLSSSQSTDSNFASLVSDLQSCLGGAIGSLSDEQGILGDSQSDLTSLSTTYSDLSTALTSQVSDAQDVNTASIATQLQSVQTQLTASYQLIAGLKTLTLTAFL